MKTFFKIIAALLFLILAALFIIPMVFKDDLVQMVKDETNAALNAEVAFGDFSLSLVKNFPNFYFGIEDVSVRGIDEFEGVALADIKSLALTVDLMSVINGESIAVKNISIVDATIHAKVLADGKANWDIAKESEEEEVVEEEEAGASDFKLSLQQLIIENAKVVYDDVSMPVHLVMDEINLSLSGDLTETVTSIKADGGIEKFDLTFDGIHYMNNVNIGLKAEMEADLDAFKFTFKENEVMVNQLALGLDGWLAMPNDPIDMDLEFHAKRTDFKEILSLIPAAFASDLEGVETKGELALDGYAKGTFIDSTYPAFGINMMVANAMFHYPDLPKSVDNINIKASVESKDGAIDNTIVDVPEFHIELGGNPFDLNFYLATPISDPYIKAGLNGTLDLAKIKDVVPLEKGDELEGIITSNLKIAGNYSTIEKEDYESFTAEGGLKVSGMHFDSDSLDYPIDLKQAALNFSPKFVSLEDLQVQLGKSDLAANGRLENFIGYALKDDEVLKGDLNISSNLLDINELAGIDSSASEEEMVDSTAVEEPMGVVLLPKNIDFISNASIKKLVFDNIVIDNISGGIALKDEKMDLTKTSMDLLGGSMNMSGFYETSDSLKPSYDFTMGIKEFDVKQTVETFNSVKQLAPIAQNCQGLYSTDLKISGAMDNNMDPIYESMNGSGKMKTNNIEVKDYKPLKKVADAIKYQKLNPMSLKDVNISFNIVEGKVFVEPFTTKIGNTDLTIAGSNSFDQTIDYLFSFAIPRSEFGGTANAAVDGLLAQAAGKGVDVKLSDVINVDVRLSGPASNPKIGTDFKQNKSKATEAIKEKINEEIDKQKEILEAKAREEIEKQKKKAEAEAKKLIDEQKKKAEEELKKQKEAAKKKLEEEAKKKLKGLFK